jgi:hypothetical protein
MLRDDKLIGWLAIGRGRVEPFTENEIELVTDFAAQAALEITRRERELRELQMELAHTNRVVTMGQLSASITHEVNRPIAAARNNVIAVTLGVPFSLRPFEASSLDDGVEFFRLRFDSMVEWERPAAEVAYPNAQ